MDGRYIARRVQVGEKLTIVNFAQDAGPDRFVENVKNKWQCSGPGLGRDLPDLAEGVGVKPPGIVLISNPVNR